MIQKLLKARRSLIQALPHYTCFDVVSALATITDVLMTYEVGSMGDVGCTVYIYGHGKGVVTAVDYKNETTTYSIYLYSQKRTITGIVKGAFDFYEQDQLIGFN